MKLCILTNILAPYRLPLFEEIRKRVEQLDVVLMAGKEKNRQWQIGKYQFKTHQLPGIHFKLPGQPFSIHVNYAVSGILKQINPDVLISGGFAPANIATFRCCRKLGKKHLVWGELHDQDRNTSQWRRFIRRKLISGSDGAIASSGKAKEILNFYGLPEEKILTSVMPIDVDSYAAKADAFRLSSGYTELRDRYAGPILLSIGRLTDSKGYWELFKIYQKILLENSAVNLLILGDGPNRSNYEDYCHSNRLNNVRFLGFQQPEKLIQYLAVADLFIFHSLRDPFGAVVSEAMAAGTAVVSSIHGGVTADLVIDGENGFTIDPCNIEETASVIIGALNQSPDSRQQMIAKAREQVGKHTFTSEAEAMVTFSRQLAEEQ